MLDLFLGWVVDLGFELYPAQENALLEIMAGRHVILNTPTGSGKSLRATQVVEGWQASLGLPALVCHCR